LPLTLLMSALFNIEYISEGTSLLTSGVPDQSLSLPRGARELLQVLGLNNESIQPIYYPNFRLLFGFNPGVSQGL
jgi:hypothetical protein